MIGSSRMWLLSAYVSFQVLFEKGFCNDFSLSFMTEGTDLDLWFRFGVESDSAVTYTDWTNYGSISYKITETNDTLQNVTVTITDSSLSGDFDTYLVGASGLGTSASLILYGPCTQDCDADTDWQIFNSDGITTIPFTCDTTTSGCCVLAVENEFDGASIETYDNCATDDQNGFYDALTGITPTSPPTTAPAYDAAEFRVTAAWITLLFFATIVGVMAYCFYWPKVMAQRDDDDEVSTTMQKQKKLQLAAGSPEMGALDGDVDAIEMARYNIEQSDWNRPVIKNKRTLSISFADAEARKMRQEDFYFIKSLVFVQAIIMFFFAIFTDYHDGAEVEYTYTEVYDSATNTTQQVVATTTLVSDSSMDNYAVYQDVHVMIVVGFGFLMTFLKKYGFSSVGYNLLITAISLEWGMFLFYWISTGKIVEQIENGDESRIMFDTAALIDGDIAAAAVLISFGAILGRSTPTQLVWLTFIELIFWSINAYISFEVLHIVDVGGSIVVHAFGAYFGLAVSYMMGPPPTERNNQSEYHSDLFSMIGTTFLWIFWPSFNGFYGSQEGYFKDRAFVNTVLSLSACTVSAFAASKFFGHGKFDMVHVQNATLAGGVAVGAAADLYLHPVGAMLIGFFAGILSVFGYAWISAKMEEKMNLWDTCGVHNLHGMPGVMGGIVSALVIWISSGYNHYIDDTFYYGEDYGRQGLVQILALMCTLSFAIIGGLLTGKFLTRIDKNNKYAITKYYKDEENWLLPEAMPDDPVMSGPLRYESNRLVLDAISTGQMRVNTVDPDEQFHD